MAEQAYTRIVGPWPWSEWGRFMAFLSITLSTSAAGAAPEAPGHQTDAQRGEPQASVERYLSDLVLGIRKTKFENGLDVVLHVDRSLPVVALAMTFRTGRAQGSSLPELCDYLRHHRLGNGSADHELSRGRGVATYQSAGWEHATFTQVLPADELPFALWLEGQRLRELRTVPELALRFADEAEQAFSLVRPHAHATLALEKLAWGPVTQSAPGVDLLNQRFFSPASGVLTLAGDFDGDEALRLIAEHVSAPSTTSERQLPPPQPAPAAAAVTPGAVGAAALGPPASPGASQPELSIGFVVPGAGSTEHAAVTIVSELLRPSESQWHARVLGTTHGPDRLVAIHETRGQSLLSVHFRAKARRAPLTPRALFDELARLGSRPLPAAVLERARNAALLNWLTQLSSAKERAELLGRYEVLHDDARLTSRQPRALASVTASDVQRVLRTLTPNRALVLGQQGAVREQRGAAESGGAAKGGP